MEENGEREAGMGTDKIVVGIVFTVIAGMVIALIMLESQPKQNYFLFDKVMSLDTGNGATVKYFRTKTYGWMTECEMVQATRGTR